MRKPIMRALLGAGSLLILASCAGPRTGFETPAMSDIAGRTEMAADRGDAYRNGGTVDAETPFYGRNLNARSLNQYDEDNGSPFPERFNAPDAVELVAPELLGIERVRIVLQELTGFNVVVRTRYQTGEEELNIPINGRMRINHKGDLEGLVRAVAANFDLSWRFDGETLLFDRMETRSYELPLPASTGAVNTSLSGVNVAGNTVSTTRSLTIDPWAEVTEALGAIVQDPGKVNVSRNTGQVTVFAPPSQQREAAKVLKTFDDLYSHRIGLEIATFYVDVSKSAELDLDIGLGGERGDVRAELGQGIRSALEGGIGVISGTDGYAAINLRSIAGNAGVADYQMSNTIAQNGVVAPVVLTNSRRYVSAITAGTSETGPTVETDNINSGISIYALPRLMRNGKIQLSIWVTQSELNRLDTFDTGSGFVQLPDADQRAVEYTLIMEPGETLIMGGYEQERALSSDSGGVGALGALGLNRSRDGQTTRTRMVLMVRPSLIGG
jgi:hypothetical protein